MNVIDLFCGAGGASLGFVQGGHTVIGAVDIDDNPLAIYQENLCHREEVNFEEPMKADLSETTFDDICDFFEISPEKIDIICGCPPCQNFSSLRDTEPWPEDEAKDELLQAFVARIREVKPDYVFFENVPGILSAGDEVPTTYVDWFEREMRSMTREGDSSDEGGYGMNLQVVNAADYGVPQKRRRTVALCIYGADDEDIEFPEPTHNENGLGGKEKWCSVSDELDRKDLKPDIGLGQKQVGIEGYPDDPGHRSRRHRPSTIERMKAIRKHGDSWRDLVGTEDEEHIVDCHDGLESGAHSAYGILRADEPAPTLTTRCTNVSSGRFTHYEQNRALTFREAALLMTFPDDFALPEQNDIAERMIGNAVPPRLVNHIARGISKIPADPTLAD